MRRKQQREVWNALGRDDADWAVLTVRDRRHGRWEGDLAAFYASGRETVDECLELAPPPARGKALDFGAGTGRLALALAERFTSVTAIDVSAGMLATLDQRAATAGLGNITTTHVDDFVPAADHDFALSLLVLQHLPTVADVRASVRLIAGALRPGGVAVLEIPERPLLLRARIQPRLRIYSLLRLFRVSASRLHRLGFSGISMLWLDEPSARMMFAACGLEVTGRVSRPDRDYLYARWALRRNT